VLRANILPRVRLNLQGRRSADALAYMKENALYYAQARSRISGAPAFSAQCAQQKNFPSFSMPCPTIRQEQCAHVGATAWIAHSKLSNVQVRPFFVSVKDLS
jgi:hypothetical protein